MPRSLTPPHIHTLAYLHRIYVWHADCHARRSPPTPTVFCFLLHCLPSSMRINTRFCGKKMKTLTHTTLTQLLQFLLLPPLQLSHPLLALATSLSSTLIAHYPMITPTLIVFALLPVLSGPYSLCPPPQSAAAPGSPSIPSMPCTTHNHPIPCFAFAFPASTCQ